MPTDAEIRSWAKDSGLDVPARGAIPAHLREAWAAYHDNAEPLPGPLADEPGLEGPPADTRPRNIRSARSAGAGWPWKRGGKPAKGKGRGRRTARVPVDDLIAGAWRAGAGWLDQVFPATAKMMKFQAPVAGLVLEEPVKDTLVDRMLQPIARSSQTGEVLAVLLGPPLLVAAIEQDPRRIPFVIPALRELLLRWHRIAGPKILLAAQRETEFEEQYGQDVDDFIDDLLRLVMATRPAADEGEGPADEGDGPTRGGHGLIA
jgi:hypothetical protein